MSLKEGYLLLRNLLGLLYHPFKTLRAIFREQDRSQTLLILGLPFYTVIAGIGSVWLGRKLIHAPRGDWGFWTYSGLAVTFIASLAMFFYLCFWLFKIWELTYKKRNR